MGASIQSQRFDVRVEAAQEILPQPCLPEFIEVKAIDEIILGAIQ